MSIIVCSFHFHFTCPGHELSANLKPLGAMTGAVQGGGSNQSRPRVESMRGLDVEQRDHVMIE